MSEEISVYIRANFLFENGKIDEAAQIMEHYRIVLPNFDAHPLLGTLRAKILFEHGYHVLAINSLSNLYKMHPHFQDIRKTLGNMLLKVGDLKDAAYFLRKYYESIHYDDNKKYYVFGDSHAWHFFAGIPRCDVAPIRPRSMYKFAIEGFNEVDKNRFEQIPDGGLAIFVYGEIDVRVHIYNKRAGDNRHVNDIILELGRDYLSRIIELKHNRPNIDFSVCSICPPSNYNLTYKTGERQIKGTSRERANATITFNNLLKGMCQKFGISYIDIHKYFSDSNGVMIPDVSDGINHVAPHFCDLVELELDIVYNWNLMKP